MSNPAPTHAAQIRELNDKVRYTMWSVFKLDEVYGDAPAEDRAAEAQELAAFYEKLAADDVVVRGTYDVSGFRADADVMIWWHAEESEKLQAAYNAFRRTAFGRRVSPAWSQMALHRPAEFNKSHLPAFLSEESRKHIAVYPFVRSYEWYLLEDAERRRLLAEHGGMARDFPDVRANTVPSFALGDYEWILAFEADEMYRIVDLMRHLRGSETRRHVREEVPFYTGTQATPAELLERLP
ncbi:hydrogen peroxide-dependent heme synthase [Nocardioides jensenii]|uniref:hydrogen peroxide-dependent heme synthase n=1 Tax=Nocardioides jensenii TaxID=1843 RepID=UPI00082AD876|nr:hydrogen peroxide-dependent heme synthase [Nocardioides jensenii]